MAARLVRLLAVDQGSSSLGLARLEGHDPLDQWDLCPAHQTRKAFERLWPKGGVYPPIAAS